MRGLVWVVVVGLAAGCVTREAELSEQNHAERLAEAECEGRFACDCRYPGYESQSECVAALTEVRQEDFDEDRAAGLEFDLECAEERLERLRQGASCHVDGPDYACEDVCRTYHGTKSAGEPCDEGGTSVCEQGLGCGQGDVCVPMCEVITIPAGGICADDASEWYGYCDLDLYCDEDTGVCEVSGKIGEPCAGWGVCEVAARCDPFTDMCVARQSGGGLCEIGYDCLSYDCGDDGICLPQEAWICPLPQKMG